MTAYESRRSSISNTALKIVRSNDEPYLWIGQTYRDMFRDRPRISKVLGAMWASMTRCLWRTRCSSPASQRTPGWSTSVSSRCRAMRGSWRTRGMRERPFQRYRPWWKFRMIDWRLRSDPRIADTAVIFWRDRAYLFGISSQVEVIRMIIPWAHGLSLFPTSLKIFRFIATALSIEPGPLFILLKIWMDEIKTLARSVRRRSGSEPCMNHLKVLSLSVTSDETSICEGQFRGCNRNDYMKSIYHRRNGYRIDDHHKGLQWRLVWWSSIPQWRLFTVGDVGQRPQQPCWKFCSKPWL